MLRVLHSIPIGGGGPLSAFATHCRFCINMNDSIASGEFLVLPCFRASVRVCGSWVRGVAGVAFTIAPRLTFPLKL